MQLILPPPREPQTRQRNQEVSIFRGIPESRDPRRIELAREIAILAHHVEPVDVRIVAEGPDAFACLLPEQALHMDMPRTARVCSAACGCTVHVCCPTHDTDHDDLLDLEVQVAPGWEE